MTKKEKIKYENGKALYEEWQKMMEAGEQRNGKTKRAFWNKVGIYTIAILAVFAAGILGIKYSDSGWLLFFLGVFSGAIWTYIGISIYQEHKRAHEQLKE